MVKGQLNDNTGSSFKDHYRELKAEAQYFETETPHSYLISKFKNLRLETYSHNYTLNYPLKKNTVRKLFLIYYDFFIDIHFTLQYFTKNKFVS